jgi:hypothetical protein
LNAPVLKTGSGGQRHSWVRIPPPPLPPPVGGHRDCISREQAQQGVFGQLGRHEGHARPCLAAVGAGQVIGKPRDLLRVGGTAIHAVQRRRVAVLARRAIEHAPGARLARIASPLRGLLVLVRCGNEERQEIVRLGVRGERLLPTHLEGDVVVIRRRAGETAMPVNGLSGCPSAETPGNHQRQHQGDEATHAPSVRVSTRVAQRPAQSPRHVAAGAGGASRLRGVERMLRGRRLLLPTLPVTAADPTKEKRRDCARDDDVPQPSRGVGTGQAFCPSVPPIRSTS